MWQNHYCSIFKERRMYLPHGNSLASMAVCIESTVSIETQPVDMRETTPQKPKRKSKKARLRVERGEKREGEREKREKRE